jgi:hypothetical protein
LLMGSCWWLVALLVLGLERDLVADA